jgi:hypothetical protein
MRCDSELQVWSPPAESIPSSFAGNEALGALICGSQRPDAFAPEDAQSLMDHYERATYPLQNHTGLERARSLGA